MFLFPLIVALIVSAVCAWWHASLRFWAIVTALAIVLAGVFAHVTVAWVITLIVFAVITVPLNLPVFRKQKITAPVLEKFAQVTPDLSATEQIALEAGTIGFEGELFSGKPNWKRLLGQPKPEFSAKEKAFMDGPVETLSAMIDDWQITHELGDIPPDVWTFLKANKFFGMIIPESYGGLEFSALAHSAVLQKIAGRSMTVASLVAVPNSLGPAELILHYGTDEQKAYYLPRLADGRDIPCFALTGPYAGSDATSIPDYGVVCEGEWEGEKVLGMRVTFDKRYITLAPVATLVGLAFRMYDPDHLLGETEDLGITLAMIPDTTPGLELGRRHLPLDNPFQNGPVRGKDVFIPLSTLIGGEDMAGHGWRMLVECLSVGRAISLPSNAVGGAKTAAAASGAYTRLRTQFGLPVSQFEGVQEALARIGGYTYAAAALSQSTAAAVDRGEKPAVTSAIAKYHTTEWGRKVARDAMDVHGGKGIQLGPSNYLGRSWQGVPVGITVEGANIMTRSLMIFGQGAIRCHPYVLKEMQALKIEDDEEQLKAFDNVLFNHLGFGVSNATRAFIMGITGGKIGKVPGNALTRKYYRKLNRYSAALALCADVSMGILGGKLKFMETLSARLGDALSHLYIISAMLKCYRDQGQPEPDEALLRWAVDNSLLEIQTALDRAIHNFPVRPVAWLLRMLVFPLGHHQTGPDDKDMRRVANMLTEPGETRNRLLQHCSLIESENNIVARLNALLPDVIAAEPARKKFLKGRKVGEIKAYAYVHQLAEAEQRDIITAQEHALLRKVHEQGHEFLSVDDFDTQAFRAAVVRDKTRGLEPLDTTHEATSSAATDAPEA